MGEAKRRKAAKPLKEAVASSDVEQVDAIVRQSVRNTRMALEREPSLLDSLIVTFMYRNSTLDFMNSQNPQDVVACRIGCSACCYQMVLCAPFEVLIIAQLLLSTRSDRELADIAIGLQKLSKLPLSPDARYGKEFPCPLLSNNQCSIYERRPAVCRSVFSNSRRKCEEALESGGGDIEFLLHPRMMQTAIQVGIDVALRKDAGLNTESVELCGSLLAALQDFDNLLEQWLRGGDPFRQWQVRREDQPTNAQLVDGVAERLQL